MKYNEQCRNKVDVDKSEKKELKMVTVYSIAIYYYRLHQSTVFLINSDLYCPRHKTNRYDWSVPI